MLASRLRDVFFKNAAKEWETIEIRLSRNIASMTLFQPSRDPNERDKFLLKVFIVADEFQLMC